MAEKMFGVGVKSVRENGLKSSMNAVEEKGRRSDLRIRSVLFRLECFGTKCEQTCSYNLAVNTRPTITNNDHETIET